MMKPDDIEITVKRGIYSVNDVLRECDDWQRVISDAINKLHGMERQDDEIRKLEKKAHELYAEYATACGFPVMGFMELLPEKQRYWRSMARRLAKCE